MDAADSGINSRWLSAIGGPYPSLHQNLSKRLTNLCEL